VEHFGPPSGPWERPLGSQDSPNLPRRGHLSHQRQQKSASRGRSFVGVMEINGNEWERMEIEWKSDPGGGQNYVRPKTMIRSSISIYLYIY